MAGKNAKGLAEWLLAGQPLLAAGSGPDEIDDLEIDIPDTPNFPKIDAPMPEVKFVPGNTVRGADGKEYLGYSWYDSGEIAIPQFDSVMHEIDYRMKPLYEKARGDLQRYILSHEIFEQEYQPHNQLEHGTMEARNMQMLELADHDAYMAGLALHRKRFRGGSRDEKAFSESTSRKYDLGMAFNKYGAELDEWVGLVSDVVSGKPTCPNQAVSVLDKSYNTDSYRAMGLGKVA